MNKRNLFVHDEDPYNPIMQLKQIVDFDDDIWGEYIVDSDQKERVPMNSIMASSILYDLLIMKSNERYDVCNDIRYSADSFAEYVLGLIQEGKVGVHPSQVNIMEA